MSKQLGILFKPEMVRAILEGRKTQTRRGLKGTIPFGNWDETKKHSPWQVGDYLYVKETWWSFGYFFTTRETTKTGKLKEKWLKEYDIHFAADHEDGWEPPKKSPYAIGWWRKMSSLFLEKKDARIWLKVTNVRVERLLDISEADAIAEGIVSHKGVPGEYPSETMYKDYLGTSCVISPIHSYLTLWDSINGAGSHKENGWVWVIEFERCEKP